MNILTIVGINIKDFKCFQEKTFLFPSNQITITGDNETGKTSIYDAFCWCLFGKNSLGEKSFNYKNTLTKDGENTEVEVITKFGGREIDFKRVYEAKLTRLKEFNGYSTQCFINGIPKSVKDFEKEVYHILSIGIDEFNLLTNPKYLTEQIKGGKGVLDWQKRCELLYMLTEFQTDKELIQQNSQFAELSSALNKYNTISEFLQAIKFDISKINSEIELLPTRIDQQMKNIIPVDFSPVELQVEKEELQNKISSMENDIQDKEFQKDIEILTQKIHSNLEEIEQLNLSNLQYKNLQKGKFLQERNEKRLQLKQEYFEAEKEISNIRNKIQKDIEQLQLTRQQHKNNIEKIETSIEKIQKNQSTLSKKMVCPVCFQSLDQKDVIAENVKKQIAYLQEQKKKYENQVVQVLQQIQKAEQDKKNIDTSKLENLKVQIRNFEYEEMPEIKTNQSFEENIKKLELEISKSKDEIRDIQQKAEEHRKKAQQEMKDYFNKVNEIDQKLNIIQQNKNSEALYNELQKELQGYLYKKDELQKMYDLSSDFIQFKCQEITESINKCFEVVKWRLFKFNKTDGELKEYCEPEVNGREYKDLSASTKIIAGLDIIKAFQKHFGISLPIFIDNSESITYFPEMNAQSIKLYVQEENCPKCSSKTKRRNKNLLFQCENCGYEFNKKLEVKNG